MKIHFNRIYIIESLRGNDRKTGTELYEDLLRWKQITHPDFEAVLKTPTTRDEFISLFDSIMEDCVKNGIAPIIHFEIHGSSDHSGLVLTSEEFISWEMLCQKLRPINHQLKNELFLTMGVCHGCYFMEKEVVDKPAVFQGIVASFDIIYNDSIYMQFLAFYEELFTSFDINLAYKKLIDANPDASINYACYSAELIFAMVQTDYDDKQCTPDAFKQRVLDEINEGKLPYINRQDKRRKIREFIKIGLQTREKYFKEAYKTFFMLDDYPELEANISFPCSISKMKNWYKGI
ncbi:MAG: hypothetical protein E7090_04665 [Bacteroidales bacterium]|nr:hypothetical protein [Bacteroidales bacterium]